jgi:hypothetical protein
MKAEVKLGSSDCEAPDADPWIDRLVKLPPRDQGTTSPLRPPIPLPPHHPLRNVISKVVGSA